jgi:hypothetical protein
MSHEKDTINKVLTIVENICNIWPKDICFYYDEIYKLFRTPHNWIKMDKEYEYEFIEKWQCPPYLNCMLLRDPYQIVHINFYDVNQISMKNQFVKHWKHEVYRI